MARPSNFHTRPPPRSAVTTAGVPLKGTIWKSTPALILSNSAAKFCVRTEEAGYNAATLALQDKPKPTALVCFNDIVAIGVQDAVQVFEDAGGHPVAITGFDNTYIAALNRISLTSIEQEKAAIALRAAEILTSEPEDWKKLEGESLLLLPHLEVRNSTRAVKVK